MSLSTLMSRGSLVLRRSDSTCERHVNFSPDAALIICTPITFPNSSVNRIEAGEISSPCSAAPVARLFFFVLPPQRVLRVRTDSATPGTVRESASQTEIERACEGYVREGADGRARGARAYSFLRCRSLEARAQSAPLRHMTTGSGRAGAAGRGAGARRERGGSAAGVRRERGGPHPGFTDRTGQVLTCAHLRACGRSASLEGR